MKPNKRPHILYVEDNKDSCKLMTFLLRMSEIDISCAHGIADALRMPHKERFALFLLDLWLVDGDGSDLCARLRSEYPDIPVVFYTGCATERERNKGLASGAAAYLVKPDSDLVAPTIMALVAGARLARESDPAVAVA